MEHYEDKSRYWLTETLETASTERNLGTTRRPSGYRAAYRTTRRTMRDAARKDRRHIHTRVYTGGQRDHKASVGLVRIRL